MNETGTDKYGSEFARSTEDFNFKKLTQNNCICNICHGTDAEIEFNYVTRDYSSKHSKRVICKTLQTHEHGFWICPKCLENLLNSNDKLIVDYIFTRFKKICEGIFGNIIIPQNK